MVYDNTRTWWHPIIKLGFSVFPLRIQYGGIQLPSLLIQQTRDIFSPDIIMSGEIKIHTIVFTHFEPFTATTTLGLLFSCRPVSSVMKVWRLAYQSVYSLVHGGWRFSLPTHAECIITAFLFSFKQH